MIKFLAAIVLILAMISTIINVTTGGPFNIWPLITVGWIVVYLKDAAR